VTEFLGSAYNELATRKEDGSYLPMVELVILSSRATYQLTNTGQVGKERVIHDHRVLINAEGLRKFAADLIGYANEIERVKEAQS
jgi:hypothetical protein